MPNLRPLEYVNDALFIGLAGVCYIQWRRNGGKAAAWLALTFGVLAGVVVAGLALSATTPTGLVGQLDDQAAPGGRVPVPVPAVPLHGRARQPRRGGPSSWPAPWPA